MLKGQKSMRIALDTNILFSVVALKSRKLAGMLDWICQNHTLILSTYVLEECRDVVQRKNVALMPALDRFLESLPYEIVYTPQTLPEHGLFTIRDPADEKVVYSAIAADADLLISGDKDVLAVELERPEIMTASQFCERFSLQ